MGNLPAYIRKNSSSPSISGFNDAMGDYRPILGIWLIEIALMLNLHSVERRRKGQRQEWPEALKDSDFQSITGI